MVSVLRSTRNCKPLKYRYQSPTLGAHTHAHAHPCPWVLGGHGRKSIVHVWAWVAMGAILLVMLQFLNTWGQFR